MVKATTARELNPDADQVDPEVIAFRAQFDEQSPLDELVRLGAQRMLQSAIEAEVQEFLEQHRERTDEKGRRLVVRNGQLPTREILTGAGPLEIGQPRVRDNSPNQEQRVCFSSKILPPYLRRSKSINDLIPWLYLKGISTGDFAEALQCLLGEDAKGLSPNVIVRLKEKWSKEYDAWNHRDLKDKQYTYVWGGRHPRQRTAGKRGKSAAMHARLDGGHIRRPQGVGRGGRRLPRKRAELVRTAD